MWIKLRDARDLARLRQALLSAPVAEHTDEALAHNQDLAHRIERQTEAQHRVIRVLTFEGSEAALRDQLGRSLPDGVSKPGAVSITVRTIGNSLPPIVLPDVEGLPR